MSMKRLAILSAVGQGTPLNGSVTLLSSNMSTNANGFRPGGSPSLHGNVNVLLGGAMLSGVILVVFFICYCCHRSMRKHSTLQSAYWREPEVAMEVFTLDSQADYLDPVFYYCYDSSGIFIPEGSHLVGLESSRPPTPGPPPAYDVVVGIEKPKSDSTEIQIAQPEEKIITRKDENEERDDSGLPTYEAALKLEAGEYV